MSKPDGCSLTGPLGLRYGGRFHGPHPMAAMECEPNQESKRAALTVERDVAELERIYLLEDTCG